MDASPQNSDPTVTCVLTSYNRPIELKRAIDSVLAQTYKNIELLVVDDCSPKDTSSVVQSYSDDRIRFIRQAKNSGLAAARNLGIEEAKGQFVCFLDDDDSWMPEKIEKQLNVFQNSAFRDRLGLVYCGMLRISGEKTLLQKPSLRGNLISKMLANQAICGNGSAVMIPAEVFKKAGKFDVGLKRGIDGNLFTKIARQYDFDFVDEPLVNYYEDASDRITKFQNPQKIQEALESDYFAFNKVADIIGDYPDQESRWNARVAKRLILLKRWRPARSHLWRSLRLQFNSRNLALLVMLCLSPLLAHKILTERSKY